MQGTIRFFKGTIICIDPNYLTIIMIILMLVRIDRRTVGTAGIDNFFFFVQLHYLTIEINCRWTKQGFIGYLEYRTIRQGAKTRDPDLSFSGGKARGNSVSERFVRHSPTEGTKTENNASTDIRRCGDRARGRRPAPNGVARATAQGRPNNRWGESSRLAPYSVDNYCEFIVGERTILRYRIVIRYQKR